MPYFNIPLKENRFITDSVVLDVQLLGPEKTAEYIEKGDFEGDSRSTARALIDTGATHCSITEDLAQKLRLKPAGRHTIGTAGHPIECNQYFILLGIPVNEVYGYHKAQDSKSNQEQMVSVGVSHFKPHFTQVSGMPPQKRDFDVIIGMDLLGKMIFQYTGSSATSAGSLIIGF